MIALIGAMPEEVKIIKSKIRNLKIEKKAKVEFYLGEYEGKNIVLMLSRPVSYTHLTLPTTPYV